MRPPARRWRVRLLLLAAALLPALGIAEGVVRAATPEAERCAVWWPNLRKVFRPAAGVMPGVAGEKRFAASSLRFRGREIHAGARFRILAIGGSTTECLFLDQDEAWPERVGAILTERGGAGEVWAGNAARSGLSTRDHVVQLRLLAPLLAEIGIDLVVVLAGANDLALRLSEDEAYDPRALERPEVVAEIVPRAFQRVPLGEDRHRPLWKRSALYSILGRIWNRRFGEEAVVDEAGAVYAQWRVHRAGAARIREELPDLASALGEYRRNLHGIADLAKRIGARTLFLTQPALWRADLAPEELAMLWFGGVGPFQTREGCEYYSAAALRAGLDRYNAATLAVARARGVEAVDLAAHVPRDLAHFYDDLHFNEQGSAAVAEVVAAHLLARPPFAADPAAPAADGDREARR
ncbi:MAG: SGNH/GDSL hydrolase family protein [Planctomycetota bacterium]